MNCLEDNRVEIDGLLYENLGIFRFSIAGICISIHMVYFDELDEYLV
jgi:hypothetical protein